MKLPNWEGETVFILGGGESLKGFDAEILRGRRVIGVNEAGLSLAPWCDILFWADRRWVDWNWDRLKLHTGPYRVTTNTARIEEIPRSILLAWRYTRINDPKYGFSTAEGQVSGFDAGGRCINLVWHTGAACAVLLGFDCHDYPERQWRRGNWHEAHHLPPIKDQRKNKFIPAHNAMARSLKALRLDYEVLNATPGSALECWPKVDLENIL